MLGSYVTTNFFDTLGIEPALGRFFAPDEDRSTVVILTMAERFWPGASAVGKEVQWPAADSPWLVVGVVPDVKYQTLGEDPRPFFYRPFSQQFSPGVTLYVRGKANSRAALASALKEVRAAEPELPVTGAFAFEELVRRSLWVAHLGATLLSIFGGLALVLAAVGIYGVVSYATESRRREVGVRLALGASRRRLISTFMRQGMAPVVAGLGAGVLAAMATLRLAGNSALRTVGIGARDLRRCRRLSDARRRCRVLDPVAPSQSSRPGRNAARRIRTPERRTRLA